METGRMLPGARRQNSTCPPVSQSVGRPVCPTARCQREQTVRRTYYYQLTAVYPDTQQTNMPRIDGNEVREEAKKTPSEYRVS